MGPEQNRTGIECLTRSHTIFDWLILIYLLISFSSYCNDDANTNTNTTNTSHANIIANDANDANSDNDNDSDDGDGLVTFSRPPLLRQLSLREIPIYHDDSDSDYNDNVTTTNNTTTATTTTDDDDNDK